MADFLCLKIFMSILSLIPFINFIINAQIVRPAPPYELRDGFPLARILAFIKFTNNGLYASVHNFV